MSRDFWRKREGLSPGALGRLLLHSRLLLALEEASACFWQPLAILAGFFALSLTGWLAALDPWWHLAVLLGIAALIGWRLRDAIRAFHWPDEIAARRRLERVNQLEGRPLETLDDRMAGGSPAQYTVWEAHKSRLWRSLGGIVAGSPAPRLAKRDPFALRVAAGLLLIAAIVAAGPQPLDRIKDSLLPRFTAPEQTVQLSVDAWITPPAYTGVPPVFLSKTGGEPADENPESVLDEAAADNAPTEILVPEGSSLVVQLAGIEGEPSLSVPGETPVELAPLDRGAYRMEAAIAASGDIVLRQKDRALRRWSVIARPDAPPVVEITEKPRPTQQLALTIFYQASDDYGVESLTAEFRRADARPSFDDVDRFIETPLPVPPREAYGKVRRTFRDLTAHPWAGGLVEMTLTATDAAGQMTKTEPLKMLLPERLFQHPVARAIIAQRRQLAWDPERNREDVADALRTIANDHQTYGDDLVVFMALDMAARRLARTKTGWPPPAEQVDFVVDLLWKTALRLDDGGLSLAMARLREAENALAEALARDADMAELERLMQELQNAMQDYLDAMREDLARRMERGEEVEQLDPKDNTRIIGENDLDAMMQQLRELMRNGMKEEAQQMLAQLQRMMENMRAGMTGQLSPQAREGMEMLNEMGDLMSRQRDLLDRSFRQSQQEQWGSHGEWQGQRGDQQGQLGGDQMPMPDAEAQAGLRRRLGEVMRQFGEMMGDIPPPFGGAEQSMRQAEQALRGGDPGGAVDPQSRALDNLQAAAESARQAIMERFAQEMGNGDLMPSQGGQTGLDPFGREPSARYRGPSQGEVDIPDQGTMERAREVRDELRRRAGERSRPPKELDYIDRLLDQFR